ncbi:MAG: metal-binding protein [Acidobacteriota bacterium]|nr:metal-binding protein [Acidobacteriota bacterium]
MPSGKTHDAITMLLAVPTLVAAWAVTGSVALAVVATAATLFGGLMFGPDLDIQSRQYARWGPLRFLWRPYRALFRHRSRWSHGILFGTLIRVVYFVAVLALLASVVFYLYMTYVVGRAPDFAEYLRAWAAFESGLRWRGAFRQLTLATLAGLWWGAASHTITDVTWSVLRKAAQLF